MHLLFTFINRVCSFNKLFLFFFLTWFWEKTIDVKVCILLSQLLFKSLIHFRAIHTCLSLHYLLLSLFLWLFLMLLVLAIIPAIWSIIASTTTSITLIVIIASFATTALPAITTLVTVDAFSRLIGRLSLPIVPVLVPTIIILLRIFTITAVYETWLDLHSSLIVNLSVIGCGLVLLLWTSIVAFSSKVYGRISIISGSGWCLLRLCLLAVILLWLLSVSMTFRLFPEMLRFGSSTRLFAIASTGAMLCFVLCSTTPVDLDSFALWSGARPLFLSHNNLT